MEMRPWVLWFAAMMLAKGESPPKIQRGLRLLDKHHSNLEGSHWFQRHSSEPFSHVSGSHSRGSTYKTTENSSDHPGFTASSPERWRPSYVKANFTNLGYYGYSKLQTGHSQGSRSPYPPPLTRPVSDFKVSAVHLPKGKIRYQSYDSSGKIRHQFPIAYKKTAYSGGHKSYSKHKYPVQKVVLPSRYYQSPYQRYSIPMTDALRHGLDGRRGQPTSSSTPPTTQRMDDAYPDGTSAYGDARTEIGSEYRDVYEEVEKSTTGVGATSYDETATRGYYGDRIYMSTQGPPSVDPEQTSLKNKYFVIKKVSHGDDLETIFE